MAVGCSVTRWSGSRAGRIPFERSYAQQGDHSINSVMRRASRRCLRSPRAALTWRSSSNSTRRTSSESWTGSESTRRCTHRRQGSSSWPSCRRPSSMPGWWSTRCRAEPTWRSMTRRRFETSCDAFDNEAGPRSSTSSRSGSPHCLRRCATMTEHSWECSGSAGRRFDSARADDVRFCPRSRRSRRRDRPPVSRRRRGRWTTTVGDPETLPHSERAAASRSDPRAPVRAAGSQLPRAAR